MNNISGFIQPSVYAPPSVVSVMPQSMPMSVPMPIPVPMVSSGGRSDIATIVIITIIVVIILFVMYRHVKFVNMEFTDEEIESFRRVNEHFISSSDPLSKCGWEVRISETCPWCIKQKAILAENFPGFTNIYSDRPAQVIPTWINSKTGEVIEGMQPLERLQQMIRNCPAE